MTPDPLDRLAPVLAWEPDWSDILQRAGERAPRRRTVTRRRVLLAFALLVAVLVPLAAVAAENDWWFLSNAEEPSSAPVVVMEGTWSGHPWHLVAYRSRRYGLCDGIVADLTRPSQGGISCGPFQDFRCRCPNVPAGGPAIAAGTSTATNGPDYVLGRAGSAIRTAEVRFTSGDTLRLRTVAAPASVGDVRFFAAQLPAGVGSPLEEGPSSPIERLAGFDEHGELVACTVDNPVGAPDTSLANCR